MSQLVIDELAKFRSDTAAICSYRRFLLLGFARCDHENDRREFSVSIDRKAGIEGPDWGKVEREKKAREGEENSLDIHHRTNGRLEYS